MTSRRLGIWLAVLAAAQFAASSASLTDLIPAKAAAWFVLIVGMAQVGTAVYTGKAASMPADRRPREVDH